MDFKQIQELIKLVNKTNISEVKIADNDFQITIRTKDFVGNITKRHEPAQQITLATQPQQVPVVAAQEVMQGSGSGQNASGTKSDNSSKSDKEGDSEFDSDKYTVFKSPMIGTFYRRPGPDKEPFVSINDNIKTGDVLCVIEAMKLFNEIEFEGDGVIAKVLVEDATPVEYDQPLFLIEPA